MVNLEVLKKELEWIYASLSWYQSERTHTNREENTELDTFIDRIYMLLKDEEEK